MAQVSLTATVEKQPGIQNFSTAFPQQLSLFLAGEITPNLGTFIQVTYEQESGSFGMDMADIRLASKTSLKSKPLNYGLTINNSPAVQDLWNSTPVWIFPYAQSETAPAPEAAALISGTLEGQVAGLGTYGYLSNFFYAGAAVYRTAPQGGFSITEQSTEGENGIKVIKNVAPYWRAAITPSLGKNYLELGTYGMYTQLYYTNSSGPVNSYTDIALDGQVEVPLGPGSLLLYLTGIYEWRNLNGSVQAGTAATYHPNLFTLNANIHYFWKWGLEGSLGYILTSGGSDTLLYSPASVNGSRNGSPESNRFMAQVSYLPWQNTKFILQGNLYATFNGASKNYDGFGRNASDNNSLYALMWLAF